MTALSIARIALQAVLDVGRGTSGRLILEARDETADMKAAFEAKYQRDWNDPAGNEMKAVWADAWAAAAAN